MFGLLFGPLQLRTVLDTLAQALEQHSMLRLSLQGSCTSLTTARAVGISDRQSRLCVESDQIFNAHEVEPICMLRIHSCKVQTFLFATRGFWLTIW